MLLPVIAALSVVAEVSSVTANSSGILKLSLVPQYANQTAIDDAWRMEAIEKLWRERRNMSHTPLVQWQHPTIKNAIILFKDETHTNSRTLKHRFVWALFMWAVTEGYVNKNTHVYDASSGNTAASEAYFARLLNIKMTAAVGTDTSDAKLDHIKKYQANLLSVDPSERWQTAHDNASYDPNGFFLNQFGNADHAEDYSESGSEAKQESVNLFHEILQDMRKIRLNNDPDYFVHAAGTGGTITSVGRYIKKYQHTTQVVLADPQYSPYFDWAINGKFRGVEEKPPSIKNKAGIPGIGYEDKQPIRFNLTVNNTVSLNPAILDQAMKLPDLMSIAAMRVLNTDYKQSVGPSSGVNFLAALSLIAKHKSTINTNKKFIVTSLFCDPITFYKTDYDNDTWIDDNEHGMGSYGGLATLNCYEGAIRDALKEGADPLDVAMDHKHHCETYNHATEEEK